MLNYFDILKASSGVPVDDPWAMLWAQGMTGEKWQITTLTGSLPLSFLSKGEVLKNYLLHGPPEGAGVETKNKFDKAATDTGNGFIKNARLRKDGVVQNYTGSNITEYIPITPGENYYIWPGATLNLFGDEIYDENKVRTRGAEYESREFLGFTARAGEAYVRFTYWAANDEKVALYEGSNSTDYIPHGYSIPLTVESGAQSQDIPIYIGSSKLGEEEYLDYQEQKVYKRTAMNETIMADRHLSPNRGLPVVFSGRCCMTSPLSVPNDYYTVFYSDNNDKNIHLMYSLFNNDTLVIRRALENGKYLSSGYTINCTEGNKLYLGWFDPEQVESVNPADVTNIFLLTSTDPPVPLPAIPTYKGENTLSSTETLGEVEITGKIKEASQ